jgi:uncharacterized protein YndB with AHSA1/START domain
MTEQKKLKRRVRERMARTGERYTAARKHVVGEPFVADPGIADETVVKRTGKGWAEWVATLDDCGARRRSHAEIARHVHDEHGVAGWWAQAVTVGYERARGLRAPGQRRDGAFEVNASRTVAAPVERLIAAFVDAELRDRWFPEAKLRVRPTTAPLSARFDWEDGRTRVNAVFDEKGPTKSAVAVQHVRLADESEAERMRALWREKLAQLKRVLEVNDA